MPLYTIAPSSSRRNMHYHPFSPILFGHGSGGHSYGPRAACAPRSSSASLIPSLFKDLESDFSSLDSFFNDILSSPQQQNVPAIRSFQPRFDVREEADAFHLTGDLPGVEAGNIAVEFTDRDTLVVKGRTVRESRRGDAPAENEKAVESATAAASTEAQNPATAAATTEGDNAMETEPITASVPAPPSRTATPDSTSSHTSNYHKATVEESRDDEEGADDFVDVAAENNNSEDNPQPTTSAASANTTPETTSAAQDQQQQQQQQVQQEQKQDQGRYWISERSIGSFSRTFRFPAGSADRENVSASLKDGVLKVLVPKVKETGARRIRVE